MKIQPLSEEQIQYLNWLLNDWSHNIKNKGIVIPDIVKKMAKGVSIAVLCTTLFTACGISEIERTAERIEREKSRAAFRAKEAFNNCRIIESEAGIKSDSAKGY